MSAITRRRQEDWRPVAIAFLLVAGFVALALLIVRADQDTRTALFQLLGGAALFGGLWFTGQTYRLTRRTQRTERFSKAIGTLSDNSPAVRAGGIYILWMLATEAEAYWQVVEQLLSGYIREKATGGPVGTDVQAALTVIGSRPKRRRPVNLQDAHLCSADLSDANLELALLDRADLTKADLTDARLNNASLTAAKLSEATLTKSDLTGTSLDQATLTKTDFYQATIANTGITGADLTDAKNVSSQQRARFTGTPAPPLP